MNGTTYHGDRFILKLSAMREASSLNFWAYHMGGDPRQAIRANPYSVARVREEVQP